MYVLHMTMFIDFQRGNDHRSTGIGGTLFFKHKYEKCGPESAYNYMSCWVPRQKGNGDSPKTDEFTISYDHA